MKTHMVRQVISNMGTEQGVIYMLETLTEQINSQQKSIMELAKQQLEMIDTLQNVVNGAHAMREQMVSSMKKVGLIGSEEDDLGPSTYNIGEGKPQ